MLGVYERRILFSQRILRILTDFPITMEFQKWLTLRKYEVDPYGSILVIP
jgi:hypothetical protein